jgi:hypothetical protein
MNRTALWGMALGMAAGLAQAQTTAGTGTTIVFPVTAKTASYASEVTLYNPNATPLVADVAFYEANNSTTPGPKACTQVTVPANRSLQFSLDTQCTLAAGSHFGSVVISDTAAPPGNPFYGYSRVQNPQGIGFSIEGFPIGHFTNQVAQSIGLKRQAAAPIYQTNCFAGSLDLPVSYELRLYDGGTGAQIGSTVTGSLAAFQQYRYLDVFGVNGVNAPAGDQLNVRAEFTQTSGGSASLIGLCTVQDNTSYGADFRIAKSYGPLGAIGNVLWVAKAGGDYTSIQAAITAAALVASAGNPVVVKVAPGIYSEQVTLANYVDVEGSGPNMTRITASGAGGTVITGAQAELRNLAVINTRNAADPGANAIYQTGNTVAGSTRLRTVMLVADGATVYVAGGTLEIVGSEVQAAPSGTQAGLEVGLNATGPTASIVFKNGRVAALAGFAYAASRDGGASLALANAQLTGTTWGSPLCFQTYDASTFTAADCP